MGVRTRCLRTRSCAFDVGVRCTRMLGLLVLVLAALGGPYARRTEGGRGQANGGTPQRDSCLFFDHSHVLWTSVLSRYVKDGFVDYAGLKKAGEADLRSDLDALESVCRDHYQAWSREQQLAYWINAYNAYTVWLILDHYPLPSIRKIGLIPRAAFRQHFIRLERLRGRALSLNDIEHEILRKEFAEPRIHFAIVCASKGCPVLRSEASPAADLEGQLEEAARNFVRDTAKNRFESSTRTLHLSPIFQWFRADFERGGRDLIGGRSALRR